MQYFYIKQICFLYIHKSLFLFLPKKGKMREIEENAIVENIFLIVLN